MRLLFITQAVDLDDPVLSFAHEWVRELSKQFDELHVICLKQGRYVLPSNVTVHSLGKERGSSRLRYVLRLFSYIWKLRSRYDAVLVHQNQEYVLLAGWLWMLLSKPIYMWRNHWAGSFRTNIAGRFCKKVFCTSRFSYTASFKNTVIMPVGVDTDRFHPGSTRRVADTLMFLGRVAPSKNVDVLVDALMQLHATGARIESDIYGDALARDRGYRDSLVSEVAAAGLVQSIRFFPGVANDKTADLYAAHDIFVNCSGSGMYDKTIFEACASGCITLAASKDYAALADARLSFDGSSVSLATALKRLLALSHEEKEALRQKGLALAHEQSLSALGVKIAQEIR